MPKQTPTTHYAKSTADGGLILEDLIKWKQALVSLQDCDIQITVEKKKKPRSGAQNRFYWLLVNMIAEEMGEIDTEYVHTVLRLELLPSRKSKRGDRVPMSTKGLSTIDMESYLSKLRVFASTVLKMYLPLPNEVNCNYEIKE